MAINVFPVYDRILIKRRKGDEVTEGGIYVPEMSQHPAFFADVLRVGNGHPIEGKPKEFRPLVVQEGDVIMISEYAGQTFEIEKETYQIIREDEILAIVDGLDVGDSDGVAE